MPETNELESAKRSESEESEENPAETTVELSETQTVRFSVTSNSTPGGEGGTQG